MTIKYEIDVKADMRTI